MKQLCDDLEIWLSIKYPTEKEVLFGFYETVKRVVYSMAIERTLSIIKPDGVAKNYIGEIYRRFEKSGLKIVAAKMIHLSEQQAKQFYAIHKDRPFFNSLVSFMISGPVMVQVLEGENAVGKNRDIMGATDPKQAEKGTIRADLSESIDENTVHGSDSLENAQQEIKFFFKSDEIHSIE